MQLFLPITGKTITLDGIGPSDILPLDALQPPSYYVKRSTTEEDDCEDPVMMIRDSNNHVDEDIDGDEDDDDQGSITSSTSSSSSLSTIDDDDDEHHHETKKKKKKNLFFFTACPMSSSMLTTAPLWIRWMAIMSLLLIALCFSILIGVILVKVVLIMSDESTSTEKNEQSSFIFHVQSGPLQTGEDARRIVPNTDGSTNEFFIHLGNWNQPESSSESLCQEDTYVQAADAFQQMTTSSIPTFVLMGNKEYTDCPDPEEALIHWYHHLLNFESTSRFVDNQRSMLLSLTRQTPEHAENFALRYGDDDDDDNNVIVLGLNIAVHDDDDPDQFRYQISSALTWIDEQQQQSSTMSKQYDAANTMLILFISAAPSDRNDLFLDALQRKIRQSYMDRPMVIVYPQGSISSIRMGYNGLSNVTVVTIPQQQQQQQRPIKMEIKDPMNIYIHER